MLTIPIVHADIVSKSLVSAGINIIWRPITDTNRDLTHQSQDNFPTFSLGLEFLNDAGKEKNNGKGDSASARSRFASLSEGEMQQILTDRHSGKTKQTTNWSVSTLKGKLKEFKCC